MFQYFYLNIQKSCLRPRKKPMEPATIVVTITNTITSDVRQLACYKKKRNKPKFRVSLTIKTIDLAFFYVWNIAVDYS
jgi:hypothetical protein